MQLPVMREELVTDCPNWERGDSDKEKLFVTIGQPNESGEGKGKAIWPTPNPLNRTFRIMANGHSPGTTDVGVGTCDGEGVLGGVEGGVSGRIVSIENNDELKRVGDTGGLEGAIVLYDFKHYTRYGDLSGPIRGCGANSASKFGAAGEYRWYMCYR